VSGIGVSAVADITLQSGMEVSGSADQMNTLTDRLERMGMIFYHGHRPEQVHGSDLVVWSAAIGENNPEILEAERLGLPILRYSQYLGSLMDKKRGIAVAGTHGKTTTAAMLATIFYNAGLEPTVVCGGVMRKFSLNALYGSGDHFIGEACEYNRSFLDLRKWYAVITNIEEEHLDYYRDLPEIKEAFTTFLFSTDRRGFICVNGDDKNIVDIVTPEISKKLRIFTVGFGDKNQYRVDANLRTGGLYSMRLFQQSNSVLKVDLPVPGRFNCINSALAAVCALNVGIDVKVIEKALGDYSGTERRLERIGDIQSNPVFSDYAHHPTEISVTLRALRELFPRKRLVTIFQPHQYSRTASFLMEFLKVLQDTDFLVLTEVFRQRETAKTDSSVKSAVLYEKLREVMGERVVLIEDKGKIVPYLQRNDFENSVIIFMGAGDINLYADAYVARP
jgi:UDP-N-acetylmuramate--alanine ligase